MLTGGAALSAAVISEEGCPADLTVATAPVAEDEAVDVSGGVALLAVVQAIPPVIPTDSRLAEIPTDSRMAELADSSA